MEWFALTFRALLDRDIFCDAPYPLATPSSVSAGTPYALIVLDFSLPNTGAVADNPSRCGPCCRRGGRSAITGSIDAAPDSDLVQMIFRLSAAHPRRGRRDRGLPRSGAHGARVFIPRAQARLISRSDRADRV